MSATTSSICYLRRRAEDYPDAGKPVPRWTDLDYQAVSLLLDELGTLQRFYQDTIPELQARGLPVVLLFGIGLFIGIYGREMWEMLA